MHFVKRAKIVGTGGQKEKCRDGDEHGWNYFAAKKNLQKEQNARLQFT